ncbi:MAG: S1 family peptidase [Gammaproteobacteria bacterium]|nr:S1 family peptidase [Gammaproteobacteria bacterium]MCI0591680.1 S1 family peptidase [Gammaproteobacteria bacterium]
MANNLVVIRTALKETAPKLQACANVVATGVGYKISQGKRSSDLSMVCSVTKKVSAAKLSARDLVPATIDGIPTDVVQTGRIRALQSRTGKHRPAPGGVSIGHRDITAGTLGCLVKKNGRHYILSNNHVLANSNDAERGDAILQPGPIDGGRFPDDHIADLENFVPITFRQPEPPSECPTARGVVAFLNAICRVVYSNTRYQIVNIRGQENLVDAAIARPLSASGVTEGILEIGTILDSGEAGLGTAVKKSGRTTGLTSGEILQVDVTVDVQYGAGQVARFADQLLAGPMSQGGDSGSAVLDNDNRLVGLLFAGSDNTTIINRIGNVFSTLGLSL